MKRPLLLALRRPPRRVWQAQSSSEPKVDATMRPHRRRFEFIHTRQTGGSVESVAFGSLGIELRVNRRRLEEESRPRPTKDRMRQIVLRGRQVDEENFGPEQPEHHEARRHGSTCRAAGTRSPREPVPPGPIQSESQWRSIVMPQHTGQEQRRDYGVDTRQVALETKRWRGHRPCDTGG